MYMMIAQIENIEWSMHSAVFNSAMKANTSGNMDHAIKISFMFEDVR